MSGGFLGEGWSFPVAVDTTTTGGVGGTGPIQLSSDDEKIRQSIWIILSTAPGERVMQPDFGCRIHDLLFENLGDGLFGQVAAEVSGALARWEPRIDVSGMNVQPDASEAGLLLIALEYVVRSTNSRFNLVYPFYVS